MGKLSHTNYQVIDDSPDRFPNVVRVHCAFDQDRQDRGLISVFLCVRAVHLGGHLVVCKVRDIPVSLDGVQNPSADAWSIHIRSTELCQFCKRPLNLPGLAACRSAGQP